MWTHLTLQKIADTMTDVGHQISRYHVVQIMELRGFRKRKPLKNNELKEVEGRNEQFARISQLRETFDNRRLPIFSMDTKKKELLGNFHRQGRCYCTEPLRVNDHDFPSFADGKLVPHGIYDVSDNKGYITLGISSDTSEFVCDNLLSFWNSDLQFKYSHANTILILCDGGGSNSCSHYIFKYDLVNLSKALKKNILVAHYPSYCSKYNPIEHRLFSQITHTWDGIPLQNIEFVRKLTDTTTTKTGLTVKTVINENEYKTKRKVEQSFKDNIENFIIFDKKCPKWNYLIKYDLL